MTSHPFTYFPPTSISVMSESLNCVTSITIYIVNLSLLNIIFNQIILRVLWVIFVSGFHILYTLFLEFLLYPANMQVTPQSPIFGMLLILYLMTPSLPHVHSFDANFETISIQCLYHFSVSPSCVTATNISINAAVFNAYFHTLYFILNDTFAFLIIDCSLPPIVDNITSARWYIYGVDFSMYSNSRFSFQALLFAVFSSLVFSPALSHLTKLTGWPFYFHFWISCMLVQSFHSWSHIYKIFSSW